MKEGRLVHWLRLAARWRYAVDLWLIRRLLACRGEPVFELRGTCSGCGACCEHPSIELPRILFHFRLLRRAIIVWQRKVNGWEFERLERPSRSLVFGCRHYDPETRRCRDYENRPGCCRDYPRIHLYESSPSFFDTCTHYAYHRDADEILEELEDLGLPPEKSEAVRKRFYVWEPPDDNRPDHPAP